MNEDILDQLRTFHPGEDILSDRAAAEIRKLRSENAALMQQLLKIDWNEMAIVALCACGSANQILTTTHPKAVALVAASKRQGYRIEIWAAEKVRAGAFSMFCDCKAEAKKAAKARTA